MVEVSCPLSKQTTNRAWFQTTELLFRHLASQSGHPATCQTGCRGFWGYSQRSHQFEMGENTHAQTHKINPEDIDFLVSRAFMLLKSLAIWVRKWGTSLKRWGLVIFTAPGWGSITRTSIQKKKVSTCAEWTHFPGFLPLYSFTFPSLNL